MKKLSAFGTGLLLMQFGMAGNAQDIPDITSGFGGLISADLALPEISRSGVEGILTTVRGAGNDISTSWTFTPSAASTDTIDLFGAVLKAKKEFAGSAGLSVQSSYYSADTGSGSKLDLWSFLGKYKLPVSTDRLKIALAAGYESLENISDDKSLTALLDYGMTSNFFLTTNISWVRQESPFSDPLEDLEYGAGFTYILSERFAIGVDHVFENDIVDEKSSVTITYRNLLRAGAKSDGTLFVGYTYPF